MNSCTTNSSDAVAQHDHEPIGPDLRDHDVSAGLTGMTSRGSDGPRFVEHLFPTCSVDVGGVRYHPVEIEKDGVVSLSSNHRPDLGLLHRSLPIEFHCGNASFCCLYEPLWRRASSESWRKVARVVPVPFSTFGQATLLGRAACGALAPSGLI
jgi:hypothetical protein